MEQSIRNGRRARVMPVLSCDRGATAVEYGLVLALITLAVIGSIAMTGNKTMEKWGNVANEVSKH